MHNTLYKISIIIIIGTPKKSAFSYVQTSGCMAYAILITKPRERNVKCSLSMLKNREQLFTHTNMVYILR